MIPEQLKGIILSKSMVVDESSAISLDKTIIFHF